MKDLINGYKQFYKEHFKLHPDIYKNLQDGQSPKALVIACSDSRVDPQIITNSKPGDIFVVRNVANLVPPYQPTTEGLHGVSAALQFGVVHLKIKNIIVIGHGGCAGIKRLVDQDFFTNDDRQSIDGTNFIDNWIKIASATKDKMPAHDTPHIEKATICEKESVLVSLKNLEQFPCIRERLNNNTIQIHGWYFPIKTGQLEVFDSTTGEFTPIK